LLNCSHCKPVLATGLGHQPAKSRMRLPRFPDSDIPGIGGLIAASRCQTAAQCERVSQSFLHAPLYIWLWAGLAHRRCNSKRWRVTMGAVAVEIGPVSELLDETLSLDRGTGPAGVAARPGAPRAEPAHSFRALLPQGYGPAPPRNRAFTRCRRCAPAARKHRFGCSGPERSERVVAVPPGAPAGVCGMGRACGLRSAPIGAPDARGGLLSCPTCATSAVPATALCARGRYPGAPGALQHPRVCMTQWSARMACRIWRWSMCRRPLTDWCMRSPGNCGIAIEALFQQVVWMRSSIACAPRDPPGLNPRISW